MPLQIWSLTPIGHQLAKSTRNPRSLAWKVIHYLDFAGAKTTDQIAEFCYPGEGEQHRVEIANKMVQLRAQSPPIVVSGSLVEV